MRLLSVISRLSGMSLSLVLAGAFLTTEPFVSDNTAKAEGYHYGASFAGKRVKTPTVNKQLNVSRSGVVLGTSKRHYKKHYRLNRVEQRQREIALRNHRVEKQNQLRRLKASTRRSKPNGRFLSQRERVEILNDNVIDSEFISTSQGVVLSGSSACPSQHNCGYRIYEDGTGPRIIRPNTYGSNDLPDYDGLNGPKVITLD